MKQISKITPEITALLQYTPLQYMLQSAIDNPRNGMAYVDDAASPSACVVRIGHLLFFGGAPTSDCLSYVKMRLLTVELYEKYGVFYCYYPTDTWRDALTALYPQQYAVWDRTLLHAASPAAHPVPPAVVPITRQLMESDIQNKEMILNEVGSLNRFLKEGFGYTLLINGKIEGFCTSEYHSKNTLAIGIEVAQAHQKKGYAKAMTSAFLNEAQGKGFQVYWEAWKNNTPSVKTALSCGFQHVADYPMIFLDLRGLNRGGRAPEEHDVFAAVQRYLPDLNTLKRVPRGQSTYVYQAQTPFQTLYARFLPEDASFAAEVSAHNSMVALGVQAPRIMAFEHKEQKSGLSMMLAQEIPGTSMEEQWPEQDASILFEAGQQLALIHSIPVDGFGWIDRNSFDLLKGEKSTFLQYFEEFLADDLVCLNYYDFTQAQIDQIRGYMEEAKALLNVPKAVLVHGDFDTSHIFCQDGRFTGFIDFGEIRGNNRLFDLATFAYHDPSPAREAYGHLIRGYREAASLTDKDLYAVELMALFILLRFAGKKVVQAGENPKEAFWACMVEKQLARINGMRNCE